MRVAPQEVLPNDPKGRDGKYTCRHFGKKVPKPTINFCCDIYFGNRDWNQRTYRLGEIPPMRMDVENNFFVLVQHVFWQGHLPTLVKFSWVKPLLSPSVPPNLYREGNAPFVAPLCLRR